MFAGQAIFLPSAWSQLNTVHRICSILVCLSVYLSLYLSASSDPGYISPDNVSTHLALYPYDRVLFYPSNICRTCDTLKPARSKHCSICKHCVSRCDHHCVFINKCVGYGNYHYFLTLLLTTGIMLSYSVYLAWRLLSAMLQQSIPPRYDHLGMHLPWYANFSWVEYFN